MASPVLVFVLASVAVIVAMSTGVAVLVYQRRESRRFTEALEALRQALETRAATPALVPAAPPAPASLAPKTPRDIPEGILNPRVKADLERLAREERMSPIKMLRAAVAIGLMHQEAEEPTSGVVRLELPDGVRGDEALPLEDGEARAPQSPIPDSPIPTTPTLVSEAPPSSEPPPAA